MTEKKTRTIGEVLVEESAPENKSDAGLLEEIVKRPPRTNRIVGVVIATLDHFDEGRPIVRLPIGDAPAARARTTVDLSNSQPGVDVVVMCENGDPARPIILGALEPEGHEMATDATEPTEARVDGERVVLTAKKEIVLSCGKASITLTREGKVLIRGAYLLSRSSGANRIKGGSIQLN